MIQKCFTGWATPSLSRKSILVKTLAVLAGVLALGAVRAEAQAFSSPVLLPSDTWGTDTEDNSGDVGNPAPAIAGFTANAPVWFQWIAPQDGDVQLDTYGSNIGGVTLDTVAAVFTGTNVAMLTQLAANDDIFPDDLQSFPSLAQFNEAGQNAIFFDPLASLAFYGIAEWLQPHYGPSGLHFNAKAGTIYYFVVDSKNLTGSLNLHWAYHSAGVFRIASENRDETGIVDANGIPMLLFQCAETEASRRDQGVFNVAEHQSTLFTYYHYDVPGMLVTVTRVAGSSGRVSVNYKTVDGDFSTVQNGDQPAVAGTDYTARSGTLVFDDYEMSKTIWIPIIDHGSGGPNFGANLNRDFFIQLTSADTDGSESSDVSDARLDPTFYQAACRILDVDIDPNGPSAISFAVTNIVVGISTNITTNTTFTLVPTNAVFNFQKAHYRVPRDVSSTIGSTMVTVYVNRTGTNQAGVTCLYRINSSYLDGGGAADEQNYHFPLEPGSDYAVPSPTTAGNTPVRGRDSDFQAQAEDGTLIWAANKFDSMPIKFLVPNNHLTKFNKDFRIMLYNPLPGHPNTFIPVGMVAETTVTILTDDLSPPAGSVDEYYNPDFGLDMAPAISTTPPQMVHPGTDGEVYSLALLPNDKTVIAGRFFSYDLSARNCIALVNTNGSLDTSFNPHSGVDAFDSSIQAVAVTRTNQFLIGGDFAAYNGTSRNSIARVKADGSLDTSFDPGTGVKGPGGANGIVYALKELSDGKIMIAGDFTTFNDVPRNYLARLNSNGSLDTTFDPKDALNGPVFSLATQGSTHISINRLANGTDLEDDNTIAVGAPAGVLTVDYDFQNQPDDIRVFYGSTNGVLIFDLNTNLTGHLVIPFGPTGGLTTNTITIVMNQGGGQIGTAWSYTASIDVAGTSQLTVGGEFTSAGGFVGQDNIARFLGDGSLDTTFDPFAGADGPVHSVSAQIDGKVVIGGDFVTVNGQSLNRLARLNVDGSVDPDFVNGTGADSTVYNINVIDSFTTNGIVFTNSSPVIYVGGAFSMMNGTHRLGFARLYGDGTVDTTFLDTAYNQFAGLSREFFGDTPGSVFTSGVQSDGNVMIGGSFDFVGGGQANWKIRPDANGDQNLWVSQGQINLEPKTRDGVRNRGNVARLIGGATPGPGNIGLINDEYSVNQSQSSLFVSLIRTNGFLGPASVNFSVLPGLALSGVNYSFNSTEPVYWVAWQYLSAPSRMHEDGLFGLNTIQTDPYGASWVGVVPSPAVTVNLGGNTLNGDVSAGFQLANPSGADWFYLGGENIPLGLALGRSTAPFDIIDDHKDSGTFGFSTNSYTATANPATMTVVRKGGTYGKVTANFATTTNGSTAILNSDYKAASGVLTFQNGDTSKTFNVTILSSNYISSVEKTVNLVLSNLLPPVNGVATWSITNAVLRIINPNFQGFLNFTTNQYNAQLSAGSISLTVARTIGSRGTVTVQCRTFDDTATNGTDYTGFTNTLQWNNGDVSPKTISIPLLNNGALSGSKQFRAMLVNPQTNGVSNPALLGLVTNTILVINNDNSFGTFQFSATNYVVNENGNYVTLTVTRGGSALGSAHVDFTTGGGTASAGPNYQATNNTLQFNAGETAKSFRVYVVDDGLVNPPPALFYFNVSLLNPSTGTTIGSPAAVAVNMVDTESFNRPPGSPDVTFNTGGGMNDDVLALALRSNGQIIAGGNFTRVNGTPRNYLARLNADGSLDAANFLNGLAGANGPVRALASQTDDHVIVAGDFSSFNGIIRNNIARVNTDGSLDSTFNPGAGANNVINSVAETFMGGTRYIYAGGNFTLYNGSSAIGVVRLTDHGIVDSTFNTGIGANSTVFAVATYPTNSVYAGKVLIGGAFNNFNNHNVGYLARLNSDGSVDTNFLANLGTGASGTVRCLAVQNDGAILVGGEFTNINGTAANRIARVNADGSVDAAFSTNAVPGADNVVFGIAVQSDSRIVIVGDFTQEGGVSRTRITRLLPDGTVDTTINFGEGANGAVEALVVQPQDQMLVVGGAFTQFESQTNYHIARVYGGSMTGSGALEFTSAGYQVNENGSVGVVKILRTGGLSGPSSDGTGNISVTFTTSDGTARNGTNYIGTTNSVVFPPGEVLKTVFIPVLDDSNITANLTVNLTISNPTAPAGIGLQPNAVLTIVNVDSALAFSSANYSVAKNVASGFENVDIARLGSTNGTVSVFFTTTTNGTALAGTDYVSTNSTVTFNPGDTKQTVNIPIINNSIPEGIRTVTMLLTNASGAFLQSPSNAVLSIFDTVNSPGFFYFDTNTAYVFNEGDTNALLTVLRTNGSSGSVTLHYATIAGTAAPGVNYVDTSSTVTFPDSISSRTIAVPLMENNLVQGTVQFSVYLFNPGGGSALLDPTNATVSIKDDEFGAGFVNSTNFVSESLSNQVTAAIFVQRVGNTNSVFSVDYATVNGTATAGVNYSNTMGTLTFTNGEVLKSIFVPVINDPIVTGDLTFMIDLANPTGGAQLAAPAVTTVIIHDADAGLSFTNATQNVFKTDGNAVITIICSNPTVEPALIDSNSIPLSVNYFTTNGTAVAGLDYLATSGTMIFSNGISTNTFTVPLLNNLNSTGDRTFTVKLAAPTEPGQLVAPSNLLVTIVDGLPQMKFSGTSYVVQKSGVAANITVFRKGFTNNVASVDFVATNGTATSANFVATNGTLIFTNGETVKTFAVQVIDNPVSQPNKTVLLQLLNPANAVLAPPTAATLTILDAGGSLILPSGSILTAESGPVNSIIDPNETVSMMFGFRDAGGTNVNNLRATLMATNGINSPSPSTPQSYGPLTVAGPSVSRVFTFTVSGTNSQQIAATFSLLDGVKDLGQASFTFTLGRMTNVFWNQGTIVIPDLTNASPYPSIITVSNVGGTLLNTTVTLTNLTHGSVYDIGALVVAPNRSDTLLMNHAGTPGVHGTKITLTFDDNATNSLPSSGGIVTGTNKPTAYPLLPVFP